MSSIQTRIHAFESLATNPNALNNNTEGPMTAASLRPVARPPPSPSPSPPNLGRKTSLIDLKDWVVDDGPRTLDSTKTPTQQVFSNAKRLHQNGGPLISLESSPPKPKPKPPNLSANKKAPPQLPPRKPSYTSLKSVASSSSSPSADSLTVEHAHRYPPLTLDLSARNNTSTHAPSSSISSFHSVSLSSDTDPSTPGSVANFIATFPMDEGRDADSISLSESYEEVSASSFASPATERMINLDWEKAMAKRKSVPPKLPQRPGSTTRSPILRGNPPPSHPVSRTASASGSTPTSPVIRPSSSTSTLALAFNNNTGNGATHTPPYTPRRAAPPPPSSRASDRSSIQSTTSYSSGSHSHNSNHPPPSILSLKTRRPTPVPMAARKRYEVVFNANILQRLRAENSRQEDSKPALLSPGEARGRRAVGWRGLSVDLITGDDMSSQSQPSSQDNGDEIIGNDEKLEGALVKLIWKRSGLDSAQLGEIWNECDLIGQGALSLEAFVKGMWRIDEELRRVQTQTLKSAKSPSLGPAAANSKLAYRSNSLLSVASLNSNRAVGPGPKIPPRPKSRDILR